jgi:hypothetical protein
VTVPHHALVTRYFLPRGSSHGAEARQPRHARPPAAGQAAQAGTTTFLIKTIAGTQATSAVPQPARLLACTTELEVRRGHDPAYTGGRVRSGGRGAR